MNIAGIHYKNQQRYNIPLTTFDFPGNSREFTERLFELIKPYIMCRYGSNIVVYTSYGVLSEVHVKEVYTCIDM